MVFEEDLLKGSFYPDGQSGRARDTPPHFLMQTPDRASPIWMSHPYTHYQGTSSHASSKPPKFCFYFTNWSKYVLNLQWVNLVICGFRAFLNFWFLNS